MQNHVPDGQGMHRIVIVGGGAGGLELATLLGDSVTLNLYKLEHRQVCGQIPASLGLVSSLAYAQD